MPPARPFHIASELERLAGRHAQALERAQEALAALKLNGGTKGELARAQTQIGLARLELGASDAVTPLDEAIATFQEVEVEITPAHVDALMGRARLHLDADRAGDALPLLQRADGFWRDFDAQSRWAGEASLWLGQCLLALGRTQEANDALRRARQILARSPIPNDAQLLKVATSAHR
jgi:tetratricopeptide (TPR) repeat protein